MQPAEEDISLSAATILREQGAAEDNYDAFKRGEREKLMRMLKAHIGNQPDTFKARITEVCAFSSLVQCHSPVQNQMVPTVT